MKLNEQIIVITTTFFEDGESESNDDEYEVDIEIDDLRYEGSFFIKIGFILNLNLISLIRCSQCSQCTIRQEAWSSPSGEEVGEI